MRTEELLGWWVGRDPGGIGSRSPPNCRLSRLQDRVGDKKRAGRKMKNEQMITDPSPPNEWR